MQVAKNSADRGMLLVIVLSFVVGIATQWQGFFNEFIINDDVRQQLFWMQRWLDPELYPDTLLSTYSEAYVPWGVQGLYRLASLVVSPLLFSKMLAVGLLALLTACVYAMVRSDIDSITGWLAVAICLATPLYLYNISGGLARGFAAPLMALFILMWQKGRYTALAFTLLLQALFIPYIFAVCALAAGVAFVMSFFSFGEKNRCLFFEVRNALPILVGVGVVLLWRQQMAAHGFGPLASGEALLAPEFSQAGRFAIFPPAPLVEELIVPFGFIFPFRDLGVVPGVVAAVCVLGMALWGGIKSPGVLVWPKLAMPFVYVGFASLALYVVARSFMLKLFIPSRFISYSWEIILTVGLAALLGGACSRFLTKRYWLAAFIVVMVCVGAFRGQGVALYDYSETRGVCEAVQKTDKDSLIFGHPSVLDNVLTFGRRNVYATYELAHPWNSGYWKTYRERLYDSFRQYYSNDPVALENFLCAQSITHIVVDRADFTDRRLAQSDFFEPYDSFIREIVDGREEYALLAENFLDVIWQDERYLLLRVR